MHKIWRSLLVSPTTAIYLAIEWMLQLYRIAVLPQQTVLADDVCAPMWLIIAMFMLLTALFIIVDFKDHCSCGEGPRFYAWI